jgi:hypothetical protein
MMMKSGTEITRASVASPRAKMWAARTTRLPVMCAVNRPSSPRKLMTSTLPATKARTNGSNIAPGELSTDGIGALPGPKVPTDEGVWALKLIAESSTCPGGTTIREVLASRSAQAA